MMDRFVQDVRYAVRQIIRRPGFALIVILTLGLGIGATTSIFSLVNTMLFRPLPFENAERLVRMRDAVARPGREPWLYNTSPRSYFAMKEWDGAFVDVTAQRFMIFNITGTDEPARVTGIGVSTDWLQTLGVEPIRGRNFTPEEARLGSEARVALIGHGLWTRRFGADPSAVGRTITLNGRIYTIIGVMPPLFNYPYGSELWVPETFDRDSGAFGPNVVARLKRGVSLETAQAQLNALSDRLRQEHPNTHASVTLRAVPIREDLVGNHPRLGVILLGAVGFLLLIACANVANLLLVRSSARRTEFALRAALGARRRRQVRQVVTESLVLATLGAVLGLVLTAGLTDVLAQLSIADYEFFTDVRVDGRVLAFGLAVTVVTTLLFGLVPALRASRPDLQRGLKEGGRSGRLAGGRLMRTLVASEVALALVLLAGAGLMLHNFTALQRQDPGYATQDRLTMELALPAHRYRQPEDQFRFVERLGERLEAVPGVLSAGLTTHLPLSPGSTTQAVSIQGGQASEPGNQLLVNWRTVTPGYLSTMGIPLLAGRDFSDDEVREPRTVAVVNEPFAQRYWPGRDPLGQQFKFGGLDSESPWLTVVGVVGDVDELYEVEETVYIPFGFRPDPDLSLVVHTAADPGAFAPQVRDAVWEIDSDQPVENLTTLEEMLSASISQERMSALLMQAFAVFALLLATLGLYGVTSYAVSLRSHEFGIRKALGCTPGGILGLVLKQGTVLALIGITLGTPLALAATDLMADVLSGANVDVPVRVRMLSEASSLPLGTYLGLALLLFAISVLASFIPARRATRVDPVEALRQE